VDDLSHEVVSDVAVDSAGALTVAGNLSRTGIDVDFLTIRYNAAGQELGRHRFSGSGGFTDRVAGLAIHSQDSAYVAGTARNSTKDIITLRFQGGA
jgi:hypothetical protein